jgi:hypothetical protein
MEGAIQPLFKASRSPEDPEHRNNGCSTCRVHSRIRKRVPVQPRLSHLSQVGVVHLRECGLILPFITEKALRPRIDYRAQQETYRRMLEVGQFESQPGPARHWECPLRHKLRRLLELRVTSDAVFDCIDRGTISRGYVL